MLTVAPIKNVILAGASGSVGAPILKALLAEPSFNVSVLTRASSSSKFSVPTHEVSDTFTVDELVEAFKGQDAVVVALSTVPITQDNLAIRFIDAAVKAGVKRFIPSEFGANNLDPRARKTVPVYDERGKMLEYLISKESTGLTWTSFSCGSWLDWALNPAKSGNFLGIDVKNRKAQIWDSGNARFTITSSNNTGLAVARALLDPSLSANKQIFLSDFVTTSREIVSALEKETGQKFAIKQDESAAVTKDARQKFDNGDYQAAFTLLALSFVGDVDVGYDFEKEHEVWNEKLGLPKVTLEDIVKESVELARRS